MECIKARELIQEKLQGELNARERHELNAHLAECRECRMFKEGMGALDSLMSREPMLDAPAGFAAGVAAVASRRHRRVLTFERRNLRIAAACVAAALVFAALLPFFITLPGTGELTEKLASVTPAIPETTDLRGQLTDIAPAVPDTAPSVSGAVASIQSSWESVSGVEIPTIGFTGTLMFMLAALAAAAAALEAVYLTLPVRRKR